jgi:hypothetical protein
MRRQDQSRDIVFLLSPARCDGVRAKVLLSVNASFPLAQAVRAEPGAPLGEVFSFLSGLYFRGKLEYARAFTPAGHQESRIGIITTNRGLLAPDECVTAADLRSFGSVDIAQADARYLEPLRRDAQAIAAMLPAKGMVVLLGSIATGKYVDLLLDIFGERLHFPAEFVGRGDMSRGGLLLRSARSGAPLDYMPVLGAIRRGKRPPKLPRPAR